MKKYFLSSVCMLLGLIVLSYGEDIKPSAIVYEQEEGHIWINFYKKGIKTQYLCEGYQPQISPRGDKVAFTLINPSMSRRIGVIDIKTGKISILNSIYGGNNYGPVWSPDGKYIAFNCWSSGRWNIGVVNSNDSEFRILTGDKSSEIGFYAPIWSSDSNHIFCHDMQYLYKINISSGEVVYKEKIYNIITPFNFSVTSASKFLPSKNDRYLIIDPSDVSRFGMKGLDGPVNTIVLYDTITKDVRYIAPFNFYAQNPQWLNDNEIIFEGVTEKELKAKGNTAPLSIYKLSINTRTPELLIKNGKNPSAYCDDTK